VPRRFSPSEVLPPRVVGAVAGASYWFLIGGHAVRCFSPYRPSDDVDFGVVRARNVEELVRRLRSKGHVEVLERAKGTVHLRFEGHDVSVFHLPALEPFVEAQTLTTSGILATKLHAILDRGTRRDFFDLYVMLEQERLGIVECLRSLREVYDADVNEGLVLRALTYFDDAEAEAPLPGEGPDDWVAVRAFFVARAGALLLPPEHPL